MPHVENHDFANFVDSQLGGCVTHANPTVPGRFLGYQHPLGEIHEQDFGACDSCPGAPFPSLSLPAFSFA
jgi:hypothetical protein